MHILLKQLYAVVRLQMAIYLPAILGQYYCSGSLIICSERERKSYSRPGGPLHHVCNARK